MIRVKKGKAKDAPVVEVPRSVSVLGGPQGIDAYVRAYKAGQPCLEGVPFASKEAKEAMAKAGLGAWALDGRTPEDSRGFTMKEVQAIIPKPPKEED